jgi:hypothetical protein
MNDRFVIYDIEFGVDMLFYNFLKEIIELIL